MRTRAQVQTKAKDTMGNAKTPFTLDFSSRNTLATQMANALRQAIVSGRYRTGEALPTVREWMKLLGVCTHVPEAALDRLAKEGLIVKRPRHGCMVAPRGASIFKGHVLVVMPPGDYVHLANTMGWQLTQRLESAGYLVSRASLYIAPNGNADFSRLRLALRQSVDLAVFVYESPAAAKCAKQANVPFVTIGEGELPGAMSHVSVDLSSSTEELVSECKAAGIHSVEIVEKSYRPCKETARAFMKSGFKVKTTALSVDPDVPRPESIMAASLSAFKRRFSHSVGRLPDLMLFDDNFLAQGAVPVLMQRGVKIPLNMQVAIVSTRGLGPALPFPFMRIERNGYTDGDTLADGVLAYFDKGTFPSGLVLKSKLERRLS